MFAKRCYTKMVEHRSAHRTMCGRALSADSQTDSPNTHSSRLPINSPVISPNKLSNKLRSKSLSNKKSLDFNIYVSLQKFCRMPARRQSSRVRCGPTASTTDADPPKWRSRCFVEKREKKIQAQCTKIFKERENALGFFSSSKVMFSKMQGLAEWTAVLGGAVIAAYA